MSPVLLITGASTGIGRDAAVRLASAGFDVFAGVRTDEDALSVKRDGLTPVMVDVTDDAQVEAAVATVAKAGGGKIDALVNNAGVAVPHPIETLTVDDLSHQLNVNVLGTHRVTRACLPHIIEAEGRIIMVGSASGRVAPPFMGAYVTSKFALEGYTDTLRREVEEFGVKVCLVEPGQVKTPIWSKSTINANTIPDLPVRYQERAKKMLVASRIAAKKGIEPSQVSDAIEHAATAGSPNARYGMPFQARVVSRFFPVLPEWIADKLVLREIDRLRTDKVDAELSQHGELTDDSPPDVD